MEKDKLFQNVSLFLKNQRFLKFINSINYKDTFLKVDTQKYMLKILVDTTGKHKQMQVDTKQSRNSIFIRFYIYFC